MKKKQKGRRPQIVSKRIPSSKVNTKSTENHSKWIRINKAFVLPGYVRAALQKLDVAGHIGYIVGGSVRDFLLGRESKDHDIATSAEPDELCRIFPDAVTVGKAFGVLKIPIRAEPNAPQFLEIATFRKDLEYKDHRHPRDVIFAGPIEDASRRDFTINALFYDPKTSRILDAVDGTSDLKAKIIKAIGNPQERFREDALRLLRAVRFSSSLDFEIEQATGMAIKERARLISKVSAERIRDEVNQMLLGPRPSRALKQLSEFGLLTYILPELEAYKGVEQSAVYHPEGDVWKHTLKIIGLLPSLNLQKSKTLAWAFLLHDAGKPAAAMRSGGKNFNGHEKDSGKIAQSIGIRLKMPRDEIETIVALVENHLKFKDVFMMRESTLQRFLRQPFFEELLILHKADSISSDGNLAYYEFCERKLDEIKKEPSTKKTKVITGEDLIQLGFSPGPEFSKILKAIEDLVFEGKIDSKEMALEYVVKHFVK